MSLEIEYATVTGVLLSDGWHAVDPKTFDTDAYEFQEGTRVNRRTIVSAGSVAGIPTTGFTFREDGIQIVGPLTSILALKR